MGSKCQLIEAFQPPKIVLLKSPIPKNCLTLSAQNNFNLIHNGSKYNFHKSSQNPLEYFRYTNCMHAPRYSRCQWIISQTDHGRKWSISLRGLHQSGAIGNLVLFNFNGACPPLKTTFWEKVPVDKLACTVSLQ